MRERLPASLEGVVVEITEEERVLDTEALQRHLDPLRARGARIAVDDAGEGYAGLQQVMSMRADIIKLDRALVADVHSDPAKIALIGSLVHFARSTGASICAKGIETLDELRVLIHLGVSTGQGWALARPGAPWPRVNAEAAALCRELRSEQSKIVPIGSKAGAHSDALQARDPGQARRDVRAHGVRAHRGRPAVGARERGATIADLFGYGAVVVNVYRPAFDDMLTAAAVGSEESIQQLVGRGSPADTWHPLLAERFERRGAYFVPAEDFDWEELGVETYVPDIEPTDDPDAWQAEDALFVPLHDSSGRAHRGGVGRRA